MPHWLSKNHVLQVQDKMMQKYGLHVGLGTAWLQPEEVLKDRIRHLVKRGWLQTANGSTVWIQILGDATGIWKSRKVNGTAVVLKVMHNSNRVRPYLHHSNCN